MKKAITVSLLFMLLIGCRSSLDKLRTHNRKKLLKLSVGLTREQAVAAMGHRKGGGRFGEPRVNSPYKSEILQGKEKTYEVLYYYTDIESPFYIANPSTISDNELTPLVFENDVLIGWGKGFLKSKTNIIVSPDS